MGKRALRKDFITEVTGSLNRFLSIFLIVALGVAFFAGIRATNPDMRITADSYYDENNLMDIRVFGTMGLTEEDVTAVSELDGVALAEPEYSADVLCEADGGDLALKVISLTEHLNQYTVTEGRLPEKPDEILVDTAFIRDTGYQLGDTIHITSGTDQELKETLSEDTFTIVGIGTTPYYLSFQRGSTSIGSGKLSSFIVVLPEVFSMKAYTCINVSVKGAKELTAYTTEYDTLVSDILEQIEAISEGWYVLDRSSVAAYTEFEQNADRIGAIGQVFPVIFFLVAALISLTTMTRMVEEERTQIGILKALGYSKLAIAMKYMLYALLATLGGSIFGAIVGLKLLPTVIITAYKMLYSGIPRIVTPFNTYYAILATILSVFCVGVATLLACYKELLSKPANLMRPVAPKVGKRVLLERIPFVWKQLNFTWKATVRNMLRYKKRFFMTIFGIGGCMALLLVGFGLKDSIFVIYTRQFDELMVYDALASIDSKATQEQVTELENAIEDNDRIAASMRVRAGSADVSFQGETKNVTVFIPEQPEDMQQYIVLRKRIGHREIELKDDGIVLTEQVAKQLGAGIGDMVTVKLNDKEVEVTISDITENYLTHYLYITPALYESLFGEAVTYNSYFLLLPGLSEEQQLEVGNSLLSNSGAEGVSYTSYLQNLLSNVLVSLNVVVWVLIVSAGALAFVVLYNLNNININERRRELATLKVLGFYHKEMGAYVFRENILLTVIGTLFGIVFGIFLHRYVILTVEIDIVMFGRNINPGSYIYSILLTFLFSALVNFVMYYKIKKVNMVESLKSVE
jgi:putative ABC transport system permease protein